MRRPGAPGPICLLCDVDLGDDPHWHDIFQAWVCDTHCPCHQLSDGSGPEPDDSDGDLSDPVDHGTTSATRTAGAAVSAAIRAPRPTEAPMTDPVLGGAYIVCRHWIDGELDTDGCDACRADAYVMEIVRLRTLVREATWAVRHDFGRDAIADRLEAAL